MSSHRAAFAFVYTILGLVAVAVIIAGVHYWPQAPQEVVVIEACKGQHGMERCIREQMATQGAPDPNVTCQAGCYDLVAFRSKRDAYPIIESGAQRASC